MQLDLPEFKLVILCILLPHRRVTVLQTVDLEQTAGVRDPHKVRQINQICQLQLVRRIIRLLCQLLDRLHALPRENVITELEAESLLEKVAVGRVLTAEHSLPDLVQASILNEKYRFNGRLMVDNRPNPSVHLLFDSIRGLCNVTDRFCIDAAFCN